MQGPARDSEVRPRRELKLYENHFENDELTFYEYTFDSKAQLVEKLEQSQYTEQEIIDIITRS
jgi:hypothetical protein